MHVNIMEEAPVKLKFVLFFFVCFLQEEIPGKHPADLNVIEDWLKTKRTGQLNREKF